MKQKILSEPGMDLYSQPHYSLIIPFTIPMRNPKLLLNLLTCAGERAEKDILVKYTKDQAKPIIQNLRDALKKIQGISGEKTLAIFVSEFSKKIYYFTPTKRDYMPTVYVQSKKDIF